MWCETGIPFREILLKEENRGMQISNQVICLEWELVEKNKSFVYQESIIPVQMLEGVMLLV